MCSSDLFAGFVIKYTLLKLPPEIFLFYRFMIATIVIITISPLTHFHFPRKKTVLLQFLIFGFLNTTVIIGLLFLGTAKTTLIDMSLISILAPLITILSAHYFLKEHITKRGKLGIMIALLGSIIILIEPFLTTHHDGISQISGNALILISIMIGALNGILLKKLLRLRVDPLTLSNTSFMIGFLSFIPIVFMKYSVHEVINTLTNLPIPYHLGVIYMALVSGVIAYYLGNVAQRTMELSETAVFSYIYPVISGVLAIFLLDEKLTMAAMAGSIVIIIGVIVAETRKKRYN